MGDEHQTGENTSRLAAALAAGKGGDRADTFLDEQTRLTRLQIEQLEEENHTRRRMLKLEHASAVFKLALEVAIAAAITIVAVAIGMAVWNAAHDNGLVVESFSVPPDLAGRGLTGDVVAAKILDKLSTMQAQTVSNRAPSSYANNWGDDIKVQIPDTGISVGEFNRLLHAWFGHETHIRGEIYRTPAGLAMTARTGNDVSPTFTGGDAELDALMQKAAEAVYRATQPYRYAVYLQNTGRIKEAEAAYEDLIEHGSPQDKAWAYVGVENIYVSRGESQRALDSLNKALAVRPDFFMSYTNMAGIQSQLGHDEESYVAQKKATELLRQHRDNDLNPRGERINMAASEAALAAGIGDNAGWVKFNAETENYPDFNNLIENANQNDIVAYALLHDAAGSRAAFAKLKPSKNPITNIGRQGNHAFAELLLGNPDIALAKRAMFTAALEKAGPQGAFALHRQFSPAMALGLAMKGDFKAAHALIDTTPTDCIVCLRMRGLIDARERNWNGAAYWFARAVKAAPSMPQARGEWGVMLLKRDDPAAAIVQFAAALDHSPYFADALEGWGEALLMQHRAELALEKFDETNKYAPNWARLHLKWGEALTSLGRNDDAKTHFARAARLGLTATENVELEKAKHL